MKNIVLTLKGTSNEAKAYPLGPEGIYKEILFSNFQKLSKNNITKCPIRS